MPTEDQDVTATNAGLITFEGDGVGVDTDSPI